MQITINIEGKEKTFTTSQVPMLARRKFLEIRAKEEGILEEKSRIPAEKQIELENEMINILVEIVFNNQFTADELLSGVSDEYFDKKLHEAIFGIVENDEEGNEKGKK